MKEIVGVAALSREMGGGGADEVFKLPGKGQIFLGSFEPLIHGFFVGKQSQFYLHD